MSGMGERFQLSLDITGDPALQERVSRVMRAERRSKGAEFVRAAVDAYLEDAERRLGIVPPPSLPAPRPSGPQPEERPRGRRVNSS